MCENILIVGYGKGNYKKIVDDFTSRGDRVFFIEAGDYDLTSDEVCTKLKLWFDECIESTDIGSIDRLIIDIYNRLISCTGKVSEEDAYESLLDDYNGIALGTVRVINSFVDMLDRGQKKQIAILTSQQSSINNNQQVVSSGRWISLAAVNRLMSLLLRMLRPDGYTVRICCVDQGFDHVANYLISKRCFEQAGSERETEYLLKMHEANGAEVPW